MLPPANVSALLARALARSFTGGRARGLPAAFARRFSRAFPRHLAPFFARFAQSDRDRLFAALDATPGSALQRASFSAPHRGCNVLRSRSSIFRHAHTSSADACKVCAGEIVEVARSQRSDGDRGTRSNTETGRHGGKPIFSVSPC